MIVLPNIFERYISSLRIATSIFILKNGLNTKYLKNLKKIYTAEAFLNKSDLLPLNIEKFVLSIFCAVSIIKFKQNLKFKFEINSSGNFYINQKVFTVFLLNLSKECQQIKIDAYENKIEISFKGEYKKSLSALKLLQGFYFYSIKTKIGKIIIPTNKTDKKSIEFSSISENIYDRFSPVNLFFENFV